jgi:hypothetical protein
MAVHVDCHSIGYLVWASSHMATKHEQHRFAFQLIDVQGSPLGPANNQGVHLLFLQGREPVPWCD